RFAHPSQTVHSPIEGPAPAAEPGAPAPAHPTTPAPAGHASKPRAEVKSESRVSSLPAEEPTLHKALRPLFHQGTKMDKAADGFHSGVQFAAVAYAAHNTDVPFVVLKHRVLDEKKSLAAAIHESRPALNARREANRAMDQARSEVASLI